MTVDLSNFATGIFAALGGIAVLAGTPALVAKLVADSLFEQRKSALQKVLEGHKSQLTQDTERLKAELQGAGDIARLQLKKQELIFNGEVSAASAFIKLRMEVSLHKQYDEQELDEALRDAVISLNETESKLSNFIIMHGTFIPKKIYAELNSLIQTAALFKFEKDGLSDHEDDVSSQSKQEALKLLNRLEPIEQEILAAVRAWERLPHAAS